MAEQRPLLELSAVTVERAGVTLIDRVSLSLERGAIHAVIGPNGAGKSTLLAAILGEMPFTGEIRFHFETSGRIGYVPQRFEVERTLPITVADFLAISRQRAPVCLHRSASVRRTIEALLERVALPGFGDRPLSKLSGGETQRVLLGNAIDPPPEILILDEASSGLDVVAAQRFEEIVIALVKEHGTTVLMVAHDLERVRRIADRAIHLKQRVVADGAPDTVTAGMVGAAG